MSYHRHTVPMPPGAYTDVAVSCASGQDLVSGGVADTAPFGDAGVERTWPTLAADGWRATIVSSPDALAGTETAYAICTSPPALGRLFYNQASAQAHGDVKSALATCSRGKVLGGGVDASDVGVAIGSRPADGPDADHKPNDAWRGTMDPTIGGGVNFQAYATCATGDLSHHLHYVHSSRNAPGLHLTSLTATCPMHTKVLGGGGTAALGHQLGVLHATLPKDGPDAGSTPDDGWTAAVDNESTTPAAMKSYAVCRG
jgi:hypothetical protein